MKYLALAVLSLAVFHANAQGDQTLAANETGELRLIIGIVIAVVVIIAIYLLLRKEDK
jgi:hypothetical protein